MLGLLSHLDLADPKENLLSSLNDQKRYFGCFMMYHFKGGNPGTPDGSSGWVYAKKPEVEFSDLNWDKSLKSFPPCYSHSPLLANFTFPLPLLEQKWFETGL